MYVYSMVTRILLYVAADDGHLLTLIEWSTFTKDFASNQILLWLTSSLKCHAPMHA